MIIQDHSFQFHEFQSIWFVLTGNQMYPKLREAMMICLKASVLWW